LVLPGRGRAGARRANIVSVMTNPGDTGAPGAPGAAGIGRRQPQRPVVAVVLVIAAAAVLSTATLLAVRWVAGPHARVAGTTSGLGFVRLDRPARPVSLPSLRGSGTIDLAGLAGKPIVMNFWSSDCPPCTRETPALASVARTLGGKVSFAGIDTADSRAKAIAFVNRYKVSYPVAFDPNATAADEYGVLALPVTVFLSPSGKTVVGENIGALTAARLRRILHQLYRVS
jgi:cytochrome c biogenesis protein CcmG/thiol:disulfide interchange protein DsbE